MNFTDKIYVENNRFISHCKKNYIMLTKQFEDRENGN